MHIHSLVMRYLCISSYLPWRKGVGLTRLFLVNSAYLYCNNDLICAFLYSLGAVGTAVSLLVHLA